MQLEADLTFEGANNEAHVPVPLLIGTARLGPVRARRSSRAVRVRDRRADDLVQVTFGVGADGADGLAFELYGAEHPLDVTAHY